MPEIGETQTGPKTGTWRWNGSAWENIAPPPSPPAQGIMSSLSSIASPAGREGLKQYARELIGGTGTARQEAGQYGKEEALGALSALNPVNQLKSAYNLVTTNPMTTARNVANTGYEAVTGNPRAIGSILGSMVAPQGDVATLRGINRGATAVATNPNLRSGIGYIAGAGTAMATGAGHPFIGAAIGRIASPLLKYPAQEVSNASGALLDKLGLNAGAAAGFSEADRAQLEKQGFSPQTLERMANEGTPTTTPTRINEIAPRTEPSAPRSVSPAVKPRYTAQQYLQIRELMRRGLTQDEAMQRAFGRQGQP